MPILKSFKYSLNSPKELLLKALQAYYTQECPHVSDSDSAVEKLRKTFGKIYVENSPTGLGKSFSLAEAISETFKELRDDQRIFILCPETRHYRAIYDDLSPEAKEVAAMVYRVEDLLAFNPPPGGLPASPAPWRRWHQRHQAPKSHSAQLQQLAQYR